MTVTERTAICTYYPEGGKYGKCQPPQPSDRRLAFFEDRSEGSRWAKITCKKCGFHDMAHANLYPINQHTHRPNVVQDHDFEPHGADEHDRYYCGCWGWD